MKIEQYTKFREVQPKTLEGEKEELESSMKTSRLQEYVRKEMDKIRKEGNMKEECLTDTHKIINEAEKRIKEKK